MSPVVSRSLEKVANGSHGKLVKVRKCGYSYYNTKESVIFKIENLLFIRASEEIWLNNLLLLQFQKQHLFNPLTPMSDRDRNYLYNVKLMQFQAGK